MKRLAITGSTVEIRNHFFFSPLRKHQCKSQIFSPDPVGSISCRPPYPTAGFPRIGINPLGRMTVSTDADPGWSGGKGPVLRGCAGNGLQWQ
jgi:hypothetical protein